MKSMQHILFLDVETVSQTPRLDELNDHGRHLWKQKIGFLARRDDREWGEMEYETSYQDKAAIYAEFGKIIVISAGVISYTNGSPCLRIKSFYGDDEKQILNGFIEVL